MIDRDKLWEIVMRFSPLTLAIGVAAVTLSAPGAGQISSPIAPDSLAWTQTGDAALAAGDPAGAARAFETAAAIDPANARAFNGLAASAMADELPGKAIRFYRESLALNGRDRAALAGIGEAFAAKGAASQADATLAQLRAVCGAGACPELATVQAALERGMVTAAALEPTAEIEQAN